VLACEFNSAKYYTFSKCLLLSGIFTIREVSRLSLHRKSYDGVGNTKDMASPACMAC
jgi:hypothetical protein